MASCNPTDAQCHFEHVLPQFAAGHIVFTNSAHANFSTRIQALVADPQLSIECPSCRPLPVTLQQSCQLLQLSPHFVLWYLSFFQEPHRKVGNYLVHVFLAWVLARSRGVPFVAVTTQTEGAAFQYFGDGSLLWALFKRLHAATVKNPPAAMAEVICTHLTVNYPHESIEVKPIFERYGMQFGRHLARSLRASTVRGEMLLHYPHIFVKAGTKKGRAGLALIST